MARRKKRKKNRRNGHTGKDVPSMFNPAFKALKALKKDMDPHSLKGNRTVPAKREPDPDMELFLNAMADVVPIGDKGKKRVVRDPDLSTRPRHRADMDDLEAMAALNDLVSGSVEMDITFSDEFIEGSVKGFDYNLMKKLKKGMFPVQDHIDLHGLTRQDAEEAVKNFLVQSHRLGLRCVLIVHGRGLNSENNIPVLKELLPLWLNRTPVKNIVLAFSTSRPYDGGTGAIYVLLRRGRRHLF